MTIKLPRLRVRPRSVEKATPCATQLAAMLACWAASADRMNTGQCAAAAADLQMCMATGGMKGRAGKVRKPTINYRKSCKGWTRLCHSMGLLD